jgi:hypothetical protein
MFDQYFLHTFNNIGYLTTTVPKDILDAINQEVSEIKDDFESATPANATLAGAIKHEYALKKSTALLEPLCSELVKEFDKQFNFTKYIDISNDYSAPWTVDAAWVNFQKKTEFNPVHGHTGALSFVIWLKIPYDLKEELDNSAEYHNDQKVTSCFQFVISNSMGQLSVHTIPVDKSYEGKIMIFPSHMLHTVYPFYTSDDYRISVSGNLKKKIS